MLSYLPQFISRLNGSVISMPGAPAVLSIAGSSFITFLYRHLGGKPDLSLKILVYSSFMAVITIPYLMTLFLGSSVELETGKMLLTLFIPLFYRSSFISRCGKSKP